MKANPGYRWCPTTNKPVKSPTPTVNPRKKLWAFPPDSSRDLPTPKKAKTEVPQLNFGMAGEFTQFAPVFKGQSNTCLVALCKYLAYDEVFRVWYTSSVHAADRDWAE